MSTRTKAAVRPATYSGTWEVDREGSEDGLPGILLVPGGEVEEPARLHAYVLDGGRVYSAELHPDGTRWRGEEARRTPHRFLLELKGAWSPGDSDEFRIWGKLHTPDLDEDGVRISGRFPVHSGPDSSPSGRRS